MLAVGILRICGKVKGKSCFSSVHSSSDSDGGIELGQIAWFVSKSFTVPEESPGCLSSAHWSRWLHVWQLSYQYDHPRKTNVLWTPIDALQLRNSVLKKTWKVILILYSKTVLFLCNWKFFYFKTQTQSKNLKVQRM